MVSNCLKCSSHCCCPQSYCWYLVQEVGSPYIAEACWEAIYGERMCVYVCNKCMHAYVWVGVQVGAWVCVCICVACVRAWVCVCICVACVRACVYKWRQLKFKDARTSSQQLRTNHQW